MKQRPKFWAGYNAGSRHANLNIAPRDFSMAGKTDDFKSGYRFGIRDRRAGILTDNEAATGAVELAWRSYASGGDVPNVSL